MKRTRFTDEQIIGILAEHEAGAKCADLCRKHGMSEGTFYNWKAKFGGMTVSEAKRLKALEDENGKLKKLLAEQMLDLSGLYKSQGFHAPGPSGRVISSFACTSNRSASDCGTVFLIPGEQCPDDPCILVRDSHDGPVRASALSKFVHPLAEPVRLPRSGSHDSSCPVDQQGSEMLVSAS